MSVGFRALALRNHNSHNSSQNGLITDQGKTSFTRRKMGRKGSKKDSGFHRNDSNMDESGGATGRARSRDKGGAAPHAESQASFVRLLFLFGDLFMCAIFIVCVPHLDALL